MANEPASEAPDFEHEVAEAIRRHAMTFPQAAEGASCVNRAFSAGGKNFVFLGEKADTITVRLKLADGWHKLEFTADEAPAAAELEAMITESFFLLAPKKVQAQHAP